MPLEKHYLVLSFSNPYRSLHKAKNPVEIPYQLPDWWALMARSLLEPQNNKLLNVSPPFTIADFISWFLNKLMRFSDPFHCITSWTLVFKNKETEAHIHRWYLLLKRKPELELLLLSLQQNPVPVQSFSLHEIPLIWLKKKKINQFTW